MSVYMKSVQEYQSNPNAQFLSINQYYTIARKLIAKSKKAGKFSKNQDLIDLVVEFLMRADNNYDEHKEGGCSRKTFRYIYGTGAIGVYLNWWKKQYKNGVVKDFCYNERIDEDSWFHKRNDTKSHDSTIYAYSDKRNYLEQIENREMLEKAINKLTSRQQHCIRSYYFNQMTLKEIAEPLGITLQAVNMSIKKALCLLRLLIVDTI